MGGKVGKEEEKKKRKRGSVEKRSGVLMVPGQKRSRCLKSPHPHREPPSAILGRDHRKIMERLGGRGLSLAEGSLKTITMA